MGLLSSREGLCCGAGVGEDIGQVGVTRGPAAGWTSWLYLLGCLQTSPSLNFQPACSSRALSQDNRFLTLIVYVLESVLLPLVTKIHRHHPAAGLVYCVALQAGERAQNQPPSCLSPTPSVFWTQNIHPVLSMS